MEESHIIIVLNISSFSKFLMIQIILSFNMTLMPVCHVKNLTVK